jgi:BASS family bile acid:Na+ symporter
MFGMGLTLTQNDFKRVLKYPKAVLTGLFNQLLILPLIGFTLATILDANASISVGIMILAACPGGATSNLITHLSKGDTALSVTLTAISSVITIFTIPLITTFALTHFMGVNRDVNLDIPSVFLQLLVITVIPVSLGMLIRNKMPDFADKMEKTVKIASAVVLALVIIGILVKEKDHVISYFEQAGLIALCLNLLTMLIGFISAKLLKLNLAQTITISIETGIQNGTMAIGVATIALSSSALAIPAAIYSLIMFATGFAIILIGTNSSSKIIAEENNS